MSLTGCQDLGEWVGRGLASEGRALTGAGGSERMGAVGRVGLKEARASASRPLPLPSSPIPGLASAARVRDSTSSPAGCPPLSLCPPWLQPGFVWLRQKLIGFAASFSRGFVAPNRDVGTKAGSVLWTAG